MKDDKDDVILKFIIENHTIIKEIKELLQKTDNKLNMLDAKLSAINNMFNNSLLNLFEANSWADDRNNHRISLLTSKIKELSEQLDAAVGSIRDKISSTTILSDQKDDINKIPYVCPKCKGDKYNVLRFEEGETCSIVCPTCNATGVIWK